MKAYFKNISIVLAASCIPACDKKNDCLGDTIDYMIFGHFYGKCVGEGCVEIFKLEGNHLFEDTLDQYPGSAEAYQGSYVQLPDAKYKLVKDLIDDFPQDLYSETDRVLGIPDGGDWGGLYVEIRNSAFPEKSGFWLLDKHTGYLPEKYHAFAEKMSEKIALIQQ